MAEEKKDLFFSIRTLGCKVNQYESEVISWELKKRGWKPAPLKQTPDLFIINTCTVTGKASADGRQMIRKIIRQYGNACVVVTGCYAQTGLDELEKIKGIHYIFGQSKKHLLPEQIDAAARHHLELNPPSPVTFIEDIGSIRDFQFKDFPLERNRTRPVVKVQDGCDAFCTYCIVPYTRGRSRSLPMVKVLDHINRLHASGFLEIVLTGIHLGNYGKDLKPETSLLSLLNRILSRTTIPRIRLSSIEPNEIPEEMILMARDSQRICSHFHLPLQSGDNGILKKMNRPYTREDFRRQVSLINRHMPDCGIGADILVGFPGEDDAAFKTTVDLISDLPVTYLHVFPFSPRKGTPAASFPNKVNNTVIKERCSILREIGDLKKKAFYQSLTGKKTRVLLEDKSNLGKGLLKGFSSHYVPVHVAGDDTLKNSIVDVTIKEVTTLPSKKVQIVCLGETH